MLRRLLLMMLNAVPAEEVHAYARELSQRGSQYGPTSGRAQRVASAGVLHKLCLEYASDARKRALTIAMVRTTKRSAPIWTPGSNEQAQSRMAREFSGSPKENGDG